MTAIGAIRLTNMSATLTRIAIAIAALASTLGALPASAADFVMKFGTATINETQHQFIKFYKDEVEKASNGRIEVQIYPASQLGPIPREIEGVQLGNIQGYIGPVDFFVGLSVFVSFKMNDLLKVVTVTNDTFIISIALVSKPWLDTLPADLQKVVLDAGAAVQSKAQAWEVDFTKKLASDWTALGGTVQTLPSEDLTRMKTLLDPVGDEATKGQPVVRDMLEMVRAAAARN